MNDLYPLRFKPVFKEKVWGGQKLKDLWNKDFSPIEKCGELWALSGVDGNESEVINGFLAGNSLNELVEVYMGDLVGDQVFERFGEVFPVLIKFIDAQEWLSVQVHPDNDLAWKRHGVPAGKSEMWYIIDAAKEAKLISGFTKETGPGEMKKLLEEKNLSTILNTVDVDKEDVYFMPAGRIHALGPGVFMAEIQQTSDFTYRVYDWDRPDNRDLHLEDAMEALDFAKAKDVKTDYALVKGHPMEIGKCPYFVTNIFELETPMERDGHMIDSFRAYFSVDYPFRITWEGGDEAMTVPAGEVILIPAEIKQIHLSSENKSRILEVFVPDKEEK